MTRNRSELTLLAKGFALRKVLIRSGSMDARAPAPRCVLFDNGSLQPEATLNLRTIALRLQAALGVSVHPVSLLHSSAIAPAQLGGVPAQLLEPALKLLLKTGVNDFVLVPLFFGSSAALTVYVPQRLQHLRRAFPAMRVRLGRCLVDPKNRRDTRIAALLADRVRAVIRERRLRRPPVVLVDHGSPQPEVIAVRNWLGRQVRRLLMGRISRLAVASMERRRGAEYDFGDPLLATLLRRPEFARKNVVVARQFISPGRHAGPGGDVADICRAAEQAQPGLKIHLTHPIGDDPRLIDVLVDRYQEARGAAPV
jgi:sirohydrochlorin ferrochelatase